jgi:hypothetical protein
MRTWTREQQNAAWRKWYAANRVRKMGWQTRRRAELQQWWRELKATMQCRRCGERAPECLHFHHRDASQKEISLGDVSRRGWKKERILAEVAKCEVLCANCHMKHHWQERSLSSG